MRNKSFGAVPMCRSNQQSRPMRLSGDENTGPVLSVMNSLLLSSSVNASVPLLQKVASVGRRLKSCASNKLCVLAPLLQPESMRREKPNAVVDRTGQRCCPQENQKVTGVQTGK